MSNKLEERTDRIMKKIRTKSYSFLPGKNWDGILEQLKEKLKKYKPDNTESITIQQGFIKVTTIELVDQVETKEVKSVKKRCTLKCDVLNHPTYGCTFTHPTENRIRRVRNSCCKRDSKKIKKSLKKVV